MTPGEMVSVLPDRVSAITTGGQARGGGRLLYRTLTAHACHLRAELRPELTGVEMAPEALDMKDTSTASLPTCPGYWCPHSMN